MSFQHVKAHVGFRFNERADRLARDAAAGKVWASDRWRMSDPDAREQAIERVSSFQLAKAEAKAKKKAQREARRTQKKAGRAPKLAPKDYSKLIKTRGRCGASTPEFREFLLKESRKEEYYLR